MPDIRYLARDADGNFYWLPWPQEIAGAPEVLAPPAIGGTIAPGQTVTRIPGMYAGDPTPTLARAEWTLRDASGAIAGQHTGDSYKIPPGAPNGSLELVEVMSGVGSLQARGVVQASVTAIVGLPEFTSNPRISGSAVVGQTLTRVRGVATGSPAPTITDQWLRDWVPIPGATGASYQSTPEDIGKVIGLRNQAANSVSNAVGLLVYALATVGIKITANPAVAPVITSGPTIVYDPDDAKFSLGSIAVSGTPTPEVSYLWHTAVSATATLVPRSQGATSTPTEWAPNPALYPRGTYFALQATAANAAGTDVEMSARLQFPNLEGFTTQPSLAGAAPRGSTLTLTPGAWHGSPSKVVFEWYRATSTRLATSGTTRKTGADDEGNGISVIVELTYASGNVYRSNRTNAITVTAAQSDEGTVVSTVAALITAINNAEAGDVILIAPGNYATAGSVSSSTFAVRISNKTWPNNNRVTIRGQFQDDKPVFTGNAFSFVGCSGFNLKWVLCDHAARSDEFKESNVFVSHDSSNNIELNGCSNFTLEHLRCSWARHGLQMSGCDNGVVKYITIEKCGMDLLNNTGATDGIDIHHCLLHDTLIYTGAWTPPVPPTAPDYDDYHPENRSAGKGWHPDMTQLWTLSNTNGPILNFKYRRNWLETQQHTNQHGIYSGNQRVRNASAANKAAMLQTYGSRNLLIEGNRIETNHSQGCCFEAVYDNMLVKNNLFLRTPGANTLDSNAPQVSVVPPDLPLNFHPAATGARLVFTPIGAG